MTTNQTVGEIEEILEKLDAVRIGRQLAGRIDRAREAFKRTDEMLRKRQLLVRAAVKFMASDGSNTELLLQWTYAQVGQNAPFRWGLVIGQKVNQGVFWDAQSMEDHYLVAAAPQLPALARQVIRAAEEVLGEDREPELGAAVEG